MGGCGDGLHTYSTGWYTAVKMLILEICVIPTQCYLRHHDNSSTNEFSISTFGTIEKGKSPIFRLLAS